ncbi:MAG TPA: GGDEF domain-containing protein [Polyangia bacterium]|nr:GGDEF domain-containing protein [Polyangia bacterium]
MDWDDKTAVSPVEDAASAAAEQYPYLIVLAGNHVGEMYKVIGEVMIIGRGSHADIQVVDEGISRRHARILCAAGGVWVEDLGSTNGTFVNGNKIKRESLKDGDKIQVGSTTILKFTYHDRLEQDFQRHMYESALRDGLTKVFNRKYFLDRLDSEFAYASRHKVPLSLVMLDLDHFKQVNDEHGHLAGDSVLVALARSIAESIRGEDVFARYGGEEFACLCRGIDLYAAKTFAERIRHRIEDSTFTFQGQSLRVTLSLGIASLPDAEIRDPVALVAAADEALYQAKRTGRNRVVARRPR